MRTYVSILTIFATLFLSFGFFSATTVYPAIPDAHATSRTITLTGSFATGWNGTNPGPTITVTQGDSVSITLISGDGYPHTFVVDVARDGIIHNPNCSIDKCSSGFPPTMTFRFTADMAPRTYTYYCSIHLMMMYGSFTVQPGPSGAPDFTSTSNPTTLNIAQGSTGSATITLTSFNGFSGPVTLSSAVSPNGPQVSFSPTSVTVPSTGSTSSTLTLSTAASSGLYSTAVSPGAYTITVTETSGSLSHSTTISLTVDSTSSSPLSTSMGDLFSSAVLAGVIGAIALVILATAAVLLRRRRKN